MASGTANPTVSSPPVPADRKTVQVIERQLGRARFHVKLVDLLSQAALLAIGALVYLLVAALADHWLFPGGLGFVGRTIAFGGMIVLCAWFVVRYLAPLVIHRINPTYAARAIEEARPTLKNSLINFLLLRQDRGGVREAVFEAVEQKAAADIATVQVESAVDRGPMIRVGYVLVGVLALFAAYKILSPKDPFRTAARVVMPWADIARPSRVQILEVTPGNARIYHGHTVPVTATINGTSADSPVWLVYSTADGQTVDRRLRMKPKAGAIQFECVLPPEDASSAAIKPGLQQDVAYRVEAGDAISGDYRLTVVAAPTIVVQQLEFEFPPYTKKPKQIIDKQGDIQAIEGTKVTIHALANQPIQSVFIELDPNESPKGAAEIVPLEFEGQQAWGTITLQLASDRTTPWHTSYQVRFINDEGNKSEQPIRHQIDVLRDLPPEVQFLAPTERRIEVPENGSRVIEARAIDPDFGLTRLAVRGEVRGKKALEQELLVDDGSHPPQAVARFTFRPQKHGLKAGDELTYFAVAADNRANPTSGAPDPNVTTTSPYLIVIVPPQEGQQNKEQPDSGDKPPPMENENRDPAGDKPPLPMNDKKQDAGQDKQSKSEQPKDGDKSDKPMEGSSQKGDAQQQNSKNNSAKGDQEKNSGSKNSGQEQGGGSQKSNDQKGDQQAGEGSSSGTKGQSQPGGAKGQKSSGNPDRENPTEGTAGESSEGNSKGTPSGNSPKRSDNPQGQSQDNTGESTGTSRQPTRPAHDGDAIEKILEHRQEKEKESSQAGDKREGTGQSPQDGSQASKGDEQRPNPMGGTKSGEKEKESGTAQKSDTAQPRRDDGTEKADGAKGQKGTEKGKQQPGETQDEGASGEKNAKGDKTGKQPQPGGDEKKQGEPGAGEKSDQAGAKGQKQQGEKTGAGTDKKGGEGGKKNDAGAKGGNPQGPMKTDKGDQPQPGEGEKKGPGMGKNGESGAGQSGKEKTGSGDSQKANRDKKKEMNPDGTKSEESDTSPPSLSKRQSDSKGGQSGNESGGGKQGPGQSAKQAGNDAAGQNSPGDEGAGAAGEKGKGPKGDKAGDQQKADGKTGAKGSEKGDGSSGKDGQGKDAGGGPMPPEAKSPDAKNDGAKGENSKGGGNVPFGGGNPDRPDVQPGEKGEVPDSDDANLEYAKKQTDLALQYLKDQEHNPDPELLDRLGWTKEEMQEFLRRWEALQKAAAQDPKASHELDESLKSLGLKPATNRKRAGGKDSDSARDLRDSGSRTSAPKSYRDQFDNFRKGSR